MEARNREHAQKSIEELECDLYPRPEAEVASIAQGNTPEIDQEYRFQQVDIQRKDQKPHLQPPEPHDEGVGKGKLPDDSLLDSTLKPDDPAHPERYISNTPYHR